MNRAQLCAICAILSALVAVARPTFADSDCSQAERLVIRLKNQIQQITAQKNEVDRASDDVDRAEVDSDLLFGHSSGDNAVAQKNLDSKINRLSKSCVAEGGKGTSCDEMVDARREQMLLEQENPRPVQKSQSQRNAARNAQGSRRKESFELELNLRDAQSDLETAISDLNECKDQAGQQGKSSRQRKGSSSGSGWSSF